jgi:hypothetical protein
MALEHKLAKGHVVVDDNPYSMPPGWILMKYPTHIGEYHWYYGLSEDNRITNTYYTMLGAVEDAKLMYRTWGY